MESTKGGTVRYRSSWEKGFVEHLDSDPSVLEFRYEWVRIPYVSNSRTGKVRNYMPDFIVTYSDGRVVVYEIKPASRVDQPRNVKKFEAARKWCDENGSTFEVVTEVELRGLDVL